MTSRRTPHRQTGAGSGAPLAVRLGLSSLELLLGPFSALLVAGLALPARVHAALSDALLLSALVSVAAGEGDLELVQLVPLRFGSVSFRDRQKFLQTPARRNGSGFIHD